MVAHYGHDRRRRPTVGERRAIFERAKGDCENCGQPLGVDYHNAHMAAWINGGPTDTGNVRAECVGCNLTNGTKDVPGWEGIQLRDWQRQALPVILERLWQTGVATINAAPGAGKTLFAVAVFRALTQRGFVERMIVVSPNLAIIGQWKRSAGKMRVHLDDRPRDSHIEHPDTAGMVITYHVLNGVADLHRLRFEQARTLVVFDEVHHLGENASWGAAVTRMIGDVANGPVHPAAVLNMTGTLFRSGRDKRISTVRYDTVLDDGVEKLDAQADWSITTAELVGRELRPPNLYVYDSQATLMDWREEQTISGALGDLDSQQRSTVLRGLDKSPDWLRGFAGEAVRLLQAQLTAIGGKEPLKLLYCAADQWAARRAADAINHVMGRDFARLVISDDGPKAKKLLEAAAADPQPCAIVQVKMATEGFDCPQVSTIAYASNVTADLSIAQTMARAMRITDWERDNRRLLPAQILIPDNPDLRAVFATLLADIPRLIDIDEPPPNVCARCEQPRPCGCPPGPPPTPRRYELIDLSVPELDAAEVLGHDDGRVEAEDLFGHRDELLSLGVPEVDHPGSLVFARRFAQRYQPPLPRYAADPPAERDPMSTLVVEKPNPRDLNVLYRQRLAKAAGWINQHIGHDSRFDNAPHFQYLANQSAGIPKGGRPDANAEKLRTCLDWMCARVAEHCRTHDEKLPSWAQ